MSKCGDWEREPGVCAIQSACNRVYGTLKPLQFATIKKWAQGGPSPLDFFNVYRGATAWHYIGMGLTNLYRRPVSCFIFNAC